MISFLTVVGAIAGVVLFLTIAAKLAAEHLFAEPEAPPVIPEETEWRSGSAEDFLATADEETTPVLEAWGLSKEDFEKVEAVVQNIQLDPVFVEAPPAEDLPEPPAAECPDCYDCDCHGEDIPPALPETWIPSEWFEPLMVLMQKHSDHNLGRLDILEYRDRTCRIVDGRGKAGSWHEMEQILNRLRTMRIPHCVMCYPANDIGRPVEVLKWLPERL